jgi:hypothetical protein
VIARHDRYGERIDDDDVVPTAACILCGRPLAPGNLSQIDAECRPTDERCLGNRANLEQENGSLTT